MAAEKVETCYQDCCVKSFKFYLKQSGEHQAIVQGVHKILPGEFKRIGEGKSSLDVLGVGSGGGELDVQMLTLLQSTFPEVPITADIVEGSIPLTDNFKELVAKTSSLKNVPFHWHIMSSEDYMKQVKTKGDKKKFDFIHMIQMIYYVDDVVETIQFYQSLLKKNGRLMIINEIANGGWDTLWTSHKNEICTHTVTDYRSSGDVKACLEKLGLKYEKHPVPNSFDISKCFNPNSERGCRLLDFMMAKDDFYSSFTPEIRADILDLLKNKCSIQKDNKILFDATMSCILIHA